MDKKNLMVISSAEQLLEGRTRREFLKLVGLGGAVIFLPSVLASCNNSSSSGDIMGPPGSGAPLVIDFAKGDIAVLQFAYALEQLEADFYTRVVANFSSSLSANEQTVLGDIKNHEVIHREALKAVLGASNGFTVNTTYGGLNFSDRAAVLTTARTFEDLGVAAYNGAAQYLSSTANLLVAGKIVSVEARHASAIRDLIAPSTSGQGDNGTSFAPKSFDDVFSPGKVKTAAQAFVVEQITFSNPPSTFVQGPNNNG